MDFASMNYLYVLIVILANKVTSTVRVCEIGHVKKRHFSDTIANHTIVGTVMSTMITKDQDECESECHLAVLDMCYMFNYHPSSKSCELLPYKDRAAEYKVKKKDGSTFKTRMCESSPCLPSQNCVALGNQNNTLCLNFTGRIIKANTTSVCVGAKNNSYGTFFSPADGKIKTVKLVHISGGIASYGSDHDGAPGNWGTVDSADPDVPHLELHVTDTQNSRITPPPGYPLDNNYGLMRYDVPGFTVMSPELVFPEISPPLAVTKGKEFRIWFGQDLSDESEHNNFGTTCADVYVFFSG